MAKIIHTDYASLKTITDLNGRQRLNDHEKGYIGLSGLLLTFVSEFKAPGREFLMFFPYDPQGVLTEPLKTQVGRIEKTSDSIILRSRLNDKYLFDWEYNLTPDEKFILRIRAGLE